MFAVGLGKISYHTLVSDLGHVTYPVLLSTALKQDNDHLPEMFIMVKIILVKYLEDYPVVNRYSKNINCHLLSTNPLS